MQALDIRRQQYLGIALVALSAIAWSTAGFFTRLIQVDPWTMLFWRGAFGGLFIGAFIVWRFQGQTVNVFRSLGWNGFFIAVCVTLAMIPFIPALKLTAVANVMIINATLPITAALLAWVWLDERVSGVTLLGGLMSLCGLP